MAIMTFKEGYTIGQQVEFYQDTCRKCGITFMFPAQYKKDLNGKHYYCPNGHPDSFVVGETEEQKLQKELKRKEQELANKVQESLRLKEIVEAEAAASLRYRAKLKRTEKRIANGVCPCCNRTFQNLLNHMATEHPEVKLDANAPGKKKRGRPRKQSNP